MSVVSFEDYSLAVYPFLSLQGFHRTYYRVLQQFAEGRIRRLMVTMPPQHGKSVGSTTLLPAYILGLDPDLRVAIASYSATLANKFNRRVQRIIESSEYSALFPHTQIGRAGGVADRKPCRCLHSGRPLQGCPRGQFTRHARELLGVVYVGCSDPHAQRLARVD